MNQGFWLTMNILVGREFRRTGKEVMDDVQDWVEKVVVKKELSVESENGVNHGKKKRTGRKCSVQECEGNDKEEVEEFLKVLNLPKIECNFSHPFVRSRLEKLMGSNLVSLTDREYMQRLQARILEDFAESMDKRIKAREDAEMERVKNLVLTGKIPLDQAPPEMINHPIMLIEKYCNKLIEERRAKIKIPKINIPKHVYTDDTPDPPSGLSIEKGHVFRCQMEKLCHPLQRFLQLEGEKEANEEGVEITDPYMYDPEEYDRLKYESPIIRELKGCQTVEEMYALADKIIGFLQTIEDKRMGAEDTNSTITNTSTAPPPSVA